MKDNSVRKQEKSACSERLVAVPEFITCPKCGGEVELWTDEDDTSCYFCGHRVFRKERILH